MKKYMSLIFGIILGIAAQMLGGYYPSNLLDTNFDLSCMLSDIDLYPMIFIILIFNKNDKKTVFRNIFLFYLGLCLGYYCFELCMDYKFDSKLPLENIISTFIDALSYIFIGFVGAIWGYIMKMAEEKKNKFVYYFMAIPFFIVAIYCVIFNISLAMKIVDIISLIIMIILVYKNRIK